jgi:antitoxin component YwqK of YwqJK toxin-antitoxin module
MTNGTDWSRHHLRGRVLYAHLDVADLAHKAREWVEEDRRPLNTIAFNEDGYVVKEILYNLHGGVSQIGSMKYDVHGNQRESLFKNPRGGLLSSLVCEYDEAGKLLECVSTQAEGLIIKQRCRPLYNKAGKKIEETWFYEDGTLNRKYVYRYRLTGEVVQQVLCKYDDEGSLEEKHVTIYDEQGNVLEASCFDREGRKIAGPIRYRYSDEGVEIEAATISLKGDLYSTTSYHYDFDALGNWIKRLEVFKTNDSGFETRVITYRTLEYYSISTLT